MGSLPPFPNNLRLAHLPMISLCQLCLGNERESQTLYDACSRYGFFLLDLRSQAEGCDLLEQVPQMFDFTAALLSLDLEEQKKYSIQYGDTFLGFKAAGASKIDAKGTSDRFERWCLLRDDTLDTIEPLDNPDYVHQNRSLLKHFALANQKIVSEILRHLDLHLQLPPGTLASKQCIDDPSCSTLRLIKSDAQPKGDRRTAIQAHTDIGAVTVLFNRVGGLQILDTGGDPKNEADWGWVKPEEGCAIINMGDAMVKWTNGILKSNWHRVKYGPGDQGNCTRFSLAYLTRPADKTVMTPLIDQSPLIREFNGSISTDNISGTAGQALTMAEWERYKLSALAKGSYSGHGKKIVAV